MSSPNQSREVVGLLLARWLLEQAGLLEDRIIIPLDAHRAWFQKPTGLVAGEQGSQQRADLLLVGFDPVTSTVELTVVEVKLRESLSDTERGYLYRQMRDQSESTERRLRERFDPELYPVPRADALLRAKEFMTTLAFYVRRGRRYDLIGQGEAEAALDFVQDLDRGYRLEIRSVGVVFERQSAGSHVDEDEPGYHGPPVRPRRRPGAALEGLPVLPVTRPTVSDLDVEGRSPRGRRPPAQSRAPSPTMPSTPSGRRSGLGPRSASSRPPRMIRPSPPSPISADPRGSAIAGIRTAGSNVEVEGGTSLRPPGDGPPGRPADAAEEPSPDACDHPTMAGPARPQIRRSRPPGASPRRPARDGRGRWSSPSRPARAGQAGHPARSE